MAIKVEDRYKVSFVQVLGPNKLFASFGMDDKERRKQLVNEEAVSLFDKAWTFHELEKAVVGATVIDSEKAQERIKESFRRYFRSNEQHREFRNQRLELEFIAQLRTDGSDYQLTQLWPIQSRDHDPKMLPVWFDNAEQKKQFDALALLLHKRDGSDLAKELLWDFMQKFPKSMIDNALRQIPNQEES